VAIPEPVIKKHLVYTNIKPKKDNSVLVDFHLWQPNITRNSITVLILAQTFWKFSSFPSFYPIIQMIKQFGNNLVAKQVMQL
jgi:hypothetical protein